VNPLVSVIVTFHNQARFVAPTLDSVLAQTYPRMETIVVDDGSTDDTRERCARYGDRIRLIVRPNGGGAAARNSGLAVVRGAYIAHMDGDDLWHPEKIAVQVEAARRFPEAGMVVADGHTFRDGASDVPGLIWGEVGRQLAAAPEDALRVDCYEILLRRRPCISTPSQMMVPASVYQVLGGWEPRLRVVSDAEIALRIASRYPIVFLRGDLVGYRYLPSSISGPREMRSFTWGLDFFEMLRVHRRIAAVAHRPTIRARLREQAVTLARDAYYHGRRGHRAWAVRYELRLLRASRRPDLVGPYLVGLLLPAPLVAAARRLLRVWPSSRPRLNPGA
jgi:glycosyltransferase involved in cell wall biosynthesis